ncbi:cation-translocating P-type ATPase C-terminal domain-containing protein [Mesorhizobium sp. KR9-304]
MSPAIIKQGWVQTWVTSRWKNPSIPGQFSAEINNLFANRWLWAAVGLSLALHTAVIYLPFLQEAFSTVEMDPEDWVLCAATASTVLWLRELSKLVDRLLWRRQTLEKT